MRVDVKERIREIEQRMVRLAEGNRAYENVHRLNAEAAALDELMLPLLGDPKARELMEQLAQEHPDPDVRASFHSSLNPLAPDESGQSLEEWLDHPAVGLGHVKGILQTRQCLVLPEIPAGDVMWGQSWLAGLPSSGGGPWPRNSSGRTLALVVQVSLDVDRWSEGTIAWARSWGLPTHGVLQVFHDLWSEDVDALCVRHVPEPGEDVEGYPEDYDLIVHPARYTADNFALTVRSPLDVEDLDEATFDAWAEACQRLADSHAYFLIEEFTAPGRPVATVLGYGWNEESDALARLAEADPDTASGEWVLLFDIPGVRHLENWFGDEGHLEVWILREDLRAGRFEGARPLLRMG